MADDCQDRVRLFLEGYVDDPGRYMLRFTATPLGTTKLGAYEWTVRSRDGAIDWYMNGSWTGGIAVEVSEECSTPQFRPGMMLDARVSVSIFGTGQVCVIEKEITVG